MKTTLILLSLFVATASSAQPQDYELKLLIPRGAGLARLGQLCDWLRADPKINKPAMTDEECGMRLLLRGGFELNHEKARQELRRQGGQMLRTNDDAFWADLPMPANRGTPTPTATPTGTPTATPTP
jgi:hypothetical protein